VTERERWQKELTLTAQAMTDRVMRYGNYGLHDLIGVELVYRRDWLLLKLTGRPIGGKP